MGWTSKKTPARNEKRSNERHNMKTVIVGGPKTGKTTYALADGRPVYHTDDTFEKMGLDWSEGSAEVSKWFDRDGPWIIEGVSTARALRKWLAAHDSGAPCDEIVILDHAFKELLKGQNSMRAGVFTVLYGIEAQLKESGVSTINQNLAT